MSRPNSKVEEMIVTLEEMLDMTYDGTFVQGSETIFMFKQVDRIGRFLYTREQLTEAFNYCLLVTDTKR